MTARLRALSQQTQAATIDFARRLIATPSMSGEEGDVAKLVRAEMEHLGFDEVTVDKAGNVIGVVRGADSGPSVMLNGHMDHVAPGDERHWTYGPFSAHMDNGLLWGRGSTDMKTALACQIHAVGMLRAADLQPRGDVYVAAVVMEEVGGIGSSYLAEHLHVSSAVVGEPTALHLSCGHRGRVEIQVEVTGRSAHASAPQRGVNPHYVLAAFLQSIQRLPMVQDRTFGESTVAPTLYSTDQRSPNVIPSRVILTLDWRNVPAETPDDIVAVLQPLLDECLLEESSGIVRVGTEALASYTGYKSTVPAIFPSFSLPSTHVVTGTARAALEAALERSFVPAVSRFATDGGHLMAAGIPTVIFGPGEEAACHVVNETISLSQIADALTGYAALALRLSDTRSWMTDET